MILIHLFLFYIEFCYFVSAQSLSKNFGLCENPDKKLGYCIEIENCPLIKNLIEKTGNLLLTPEFSERREFIVKSKCGEINGKPLVCCENSIFGNPNNNFLSKESLLPTEGECQAKFVNKIVGGTITIIDEFPWTAVLLYIHINNKSEATGNCGGSIISNRYVITAAHCAKNKKLTDNNKYLYAVRLGEWNKNTDIDCPLDTDDNYCADPTQDISIEKILTHENYNEAIKAKHNDIALLRLSRTIKFSNFIKPICLPLTPIVQNRNLTGIALDVTGWGRIENFTFSAIKLKASLKTVSLNNCNMIYNVNPPLIENQICAGGEKGIGTCKGDSGGSLIGTYTPQSSLPYYYLVGILSVGIDACGKEGYPSVFTRVASFVPWILKNIEN